MDAFFEPESAIFGVFDGHGGKCNADKAQF